MLTRDCGPCHAGNERAGGIGSIDDVDSLVSSGWIVPGNAAQSPLFDSVRSGRMPPAGMLSRPSVGERWLLEGFIDGLSASAEGCAPPPIESRSTSVVPPRSSACRQPCCERIWRNCRLALRSSPRAAHPFRAPSCRRARARRAARSPRARATDRSIAHRAREASAHRGENPDLGGSLQISQLRLPTATDTHTSSPSPPSLGVL